MHKDLDICKLQIDLVENIKKIRSKYLNFIKYMKSKTAYAPYCFCVYLFTEEIYEI